jgi:5'-methylthioadenosine nucleosidase
VSVDRVVIVTAMAAEAAPILTALEAVEADKPAWARDLPTRLHRQVRHHGLDVLVATNGVDPVTGVDCIGGQAAALTTQVAIASHQPDLVLTVGTAGGWTRAGAEIGDVYVAWDRFVHHDHRIAIPGFAEFGLGNHPAADLRSLAEACGCRTGIITTGESLDETEVDRARILESGAEVKDMEGAAVAWVARLHRTPVSGIKAITDLVDSPVATEEQFFANLTQAVDQLTTKVLALLSRLSATDS